MATYSNFSPISPIGKALFNFDEFGGTNFRLVGTVRVSTSDNFSYADYQSLSYSDFYRNLYAAQQYSEFPWSPQMIANVQDVLGIYQDFANISFAWQGDYDWIGSDTTANPEDVGRADVSDINVTWTYRPDAGFGGISGGGSDRIFGYTGGAGDIFLNGAAPIFGTNFTLDQNTRSRQIFLHELGHSLGLSHPHTSYTNGVATISSDYSATVQLGFQQLGFVINGPADMNREYFSIMSYDDQHSLMPGSSYVWHAHTPMILDVIALQEGYGEGPGTTGSSNDTIVAGTAGYRTYFDKGGTDTIDLSNYTDGAYLNMGAPIIGAPHLVGVGMSLYDARNTILAGGDPAHLRWFYGEFENANGSARGDLVVGNRLANRIYGSGGDDGIFGGEGGDSLNGGTGNDELYGNAGNDFFDWDEAQREGADVFYGGSGDDTFVLTVGDEAIEYSDEGNDTVWVSFSYSISTRQHIENLGAFGATGYTLIGNTANNHFIASGGSDTISGGAGADTVSYSGPSGNYVISLIGAGVKISGPDTGSDLLDGVEFAAFADRTISLSASNDKGRADVDLVYVFKSEKTGAGITPASQSYFYTVQAAEAAHIRAQTTWPWVEKTATFEAAHSEPNLAVPVFRFWSDKHQSHFFTVSSSEKNQIISWSATGTNGYDWRYEGEGFKVYTSSAPTDSSGKAAIPVYRLWMADKDFNSTNGYSGGHYFTANRSEYDSMVQLVGVTGEGIAFFGEVPGA